ncbi:MAG: prolipoprotein diacylglyceryl transferase [Acidimicrobiia bacterium]
MNLILAALPSPPFEAIHIGSIQLRAYGLMIALGVLAAVWLAEKRWMVRGGGEGDIQSLAAWAVPAGVVGARLYHVVTNYEGYRGRPLRILQVWHGGLGIPGGIMVGVLTGLIVARQRKLRVSVLLDSIAPALPLAQAIGRWGNWFNQELFGKPTSLPWGVHIDVAHRPAEYATSATFHPTFLYESLWNLALVGVILYADRRHADHSGRLFALYLAGYASGRFWIERMRIDFAHTIGGLRVNEWMSIVVFAGSMLYLALDTRRRRTRGSGDSQPVTVSVSPSRHN